MKRVLLAIIIALVLTTGGCSGSNPEDLFDTAKLEELQENPEHAKTLYLQLIDTHPDSKYADMARKRLAELEQK